MVRSESGSALIRLTCFGDLSLLEFDSNRDDWFSDIRVVPIGSITDSFLSKTGYHRMELPFEFMRRLCWKLGNYDGRFQGAFVLRGAVNNVENFYNNSNRGLNNSQADASWVELEECTVFFPRGIDDMAPILNSELRDTRVLFSPFNSRNYLHRLEEDDEWLISFPALDSFKAIESIAAELRIPLARQNSDAILALAKSVPRISLVGDQLRVNLPGYEDQF